MKVRIMQKCATAGKNDGRLGKWWGSGEESGAAPGEGLYTTQRVVHKQRQMFILMAMPSDPGREDDTCHMRNAACRIRTWRVGS